MGTHDYKMEKQQKMPGLTLCLILVIGLAECRSAPAVPTWPSKYMVTGNLQLPYAELDEPFVAYFDGSVGKSRIDYYGDVVQTFQIGAEGGEYGVKFMIAPMTNYEVLNVRSCFQTNGTKEEPMGPQSVLPDLTGFKLMGTDYKLGAACEKWENVTHIGQKKNIYTMWVSADTKRPVRYEMMGYDSLLGSHYDRYYVDYHDMSEDFSDDMFIPPTGLKCGGFPGPGVKHKAIINPMSVYINGYSAHVDHEFEDFKTTHSKFYESETHELKKKVTFMHNLRYIQAMNRQGLSYSLGVNHMADMTSEERKLLRGRLHSKVENNGGMPFYMEKHEHLKVPDYMDWRLYGAVTPVKDQATCGSCWSFGTTGTIEGAYFLKTGQLVRLSQQQLVDCSWGEGNNGCDGGEDFRAYHYIQKIGGLATEMDYGAYEGIDGNCHFGEVTPTVQLKGFVNVTSGDLNALKVALYKYGPISVGIDAAHPSLSFYSHGVYYEPKCGNTVDDLDHAVLAVGYGEILGQKYWLIKNSWSTYWGNDGYVLMSQKNNNCGVASAATYVVL